MAAFPFAWPADLCARGYRARPEKEEDIPFLMRLYASTREREFAVLTDWSEEQKRAFLAQQFAAQRHHYRTHIADCHFAVIERDGRPVGRLYLEERLSQLHVVDIALMPEERGQGVGTMVLEALIETARGDGRGVGIFVEKYSPALRLYRRLGFADIRDAGVYLEMERVADPVAARIS